MKYSEDKIKLRNDSKNTRETLFVELGCQTLKTAIKCRNGAWGVIL